MRQETRIELSLHAGKSVTEKDLIGGRAKIEALCQLYYSIVGIGACRRPCLTGFFFSQRWLVSQLNRLKIVASDDTSPLAAKTTKRLVGWAPTLRQYWLPDSSLVTHSNTGNNHFTAIATISGDGPVSPGFSPSHCIQHSLTGVSTRSSPPTINSVILCSSRFAPSFGVG